MRTLVFLTALIAASVSHGAWDYDPMKPAKELSNDEMAIAEAAAMQQWFDHIQPQIKEWARCEYALLSSDKYGAEATNKVQKQVRADVRKLLPSVAPGAKAYQLGVEYTKWFYTWRGFHQGLSKGAEVAPEAIVDAWVNDCVKRYGN